jgi:anti-sigma B factor antagonist
MQQCRHIGEPGLDSFTVFLKLLKPHGGDIVLINIQPRAYEAFQLLGFDQFVNFKDTLDEAIAFFSGKAEAASNANNDIVPGFEDEKCEGLEISLRKIEELKGGLLLSLKGFIDADSINSFQRRVTLAIDAGFIRLVFDMTDVLWINETVISKLPYFLSNGVKPHGGDIVFINIRRKVCEYFQRLGLLQFIVIKANFDEAIAFWGVKGEDGKRPVFPRSFTCPSCNRKLGAVRAGRFRCSECKTILAVDTAGTVSLG